MSTVRAWVEYALHQHGKPGTAADITDTAVQLALDNDRRQLTQGLSPNSVDKHLQRIAEKCGQRQDERKAQRPLWQPPGGVFNKDMPMPERPAATRAEPPLSQVQAHTLLTSYEDLLQLQNARIAELDQTVARLGAELATATDQQRRYVVAQRDQLARVRDRFQRAGLMEET